MPSSRLSGFLQEARSTRFHAKIVTRVISGNRNANFLLALKNTRKRWNINTRKALEEHCLRSGHTVSWEASKILRTNANWRNRRILDAWEINTEGQNSIIIDSNLAYSKKRVFCELFFHFPLMKVEGSTETLGLLKHCTYSYTISTRVTFLFLNMFLSPGYRTIFKIVTECFATSYFHPDETRSFRCLASSMNRTPEN